MPVKERDNYFDQLRGIAIIAILAIHISSVIADKIFVDTINFSFLYVYRQLLNFAVPLFLFVSGYFLAKKDVSSVSKYKSFIFKQANKIIIPYVIYTLIFILIDHHNGETITFRSVSQNLLTGNVISPYFFIPLIFQYYLLLPLLQKFNNFKGLMISVVINILYFIGLYAYRFGLSTDIPNLYYALVFPAWIIFYQYGLYSGKFGLPKKSIISLLLLAVSIVLLFVEANFWMSEKNLFSFAISQIRLSSFIYSFCLINVLVTFKLFYSKFLSRVGLISFGIFLTHMFILVYFLAPIVLNTELYFNQPLYQIVILFLLVIIDYLVIIMLQKIFPKKLSQILGF